MVIIPTPPNVEIIKNPIDEQLAQALETIPKTDPESNDLSSLNFEFFIAYTFIEITIAKRIALKLAIINPVSASSGT